MAKTGRPSLYTEAVCKEICDRLAEGEPLAVICRDAHMPDDNTVRVWSKDRPDLSSAIARARVTGFDSIARRARKTIRGDKGFSTGDIQRDKAIADFDLKLLAKWDPKRYGDKVALTGGSEDDAPLRHQVDLTKLPDGLLNQVIDALQSRAPSAGGTASGEGET